MKFFSFFGWHMKLIHRTTTNCGHAYQEVLGMRYQISRGRTFWYI